MNPSTHLELQEALTEKPTTRADLARRVGLHPNTIGKWLKAMRDEGRVCIWEWGKAADGRLTVPIYLWAPDGDAPRPGPKLTPAERMRELRKRRKEQQTNVKGNEQ